MASHQVHFVGLVVAKKGNQPDECDDHIGQSPNTPFRAVVADGATEGLLNGRWAEAIVRRCTAESSPDSPSSMLQALEEARTAWVDEVAAYRKDRERTNRPIQWYEEPGLRTGSFSTLLYLTVDGRRPWVLAKRKVKRKRLHQSQGTHWWACAVGDSCLFVVTKEGKRRRFGDHPVVFPITASVDFNSSPHLVSTRVAPSPGAVQELSGDARTGDCMYLMTDAIACWTLRQIESRETPWSRLDEGLRSKERFRRMVDELREDHGMRNDDVSVVRVDF